VVGGKVAIDVENIGFVPTSISRIELGGAEPGDFVILEESCLDRALNPDGTCTVEVEFRPTAAGYRSALVIATTARGQYSAAVLGGFARYEPTFAVDDELTPRPGGAIGVVGDGFPAGSKVSIGFDDGSPPFATVKADEAGSFLQVVDLPVRIRIGERRIVATSSGNAVAAATIDVERRQTVEQPQLPGFGW